MEMRRFTRLTNGFAAPSSAANRQSLIGAELCHTPGLVTF